MTDSEDRVLYPVGARVVDTTGRVGTITKVYPQHRSFPYDVKFDDQDYDTSPLWNQVQLVPKALQP